MHKPMVTTEGAGLFSFEFWNDTMTRGVSFHFLPFEDIQWGYEEGWFDGPLHLLGIGPFLLVCWTWW